MFSNKTYNNRSQPQKLTNSKNYNRPKYTVQEQLSTEEIKTKLKEYLPVDKIDDVKLGTHVRYYKKNEQSGEYQFRLGGLLDKKNHSEYVILNNGKHSWSVQKKTAQFYRKMTKEEFEKRIKEQYINMKDRFAKKMNIKDDIIDKNSKEIEKLKQQIFILNGGGGIKDTNLNNDSKYTNLSNVTISKNKDNESINNKNSNDLPYRSSHRRSSDHRRSDHRSSDHRSSDHRSSQRRSSHNLSSNDKNSNDTSLHHKSSNDKSSIDKKNLHNSDSYNKNKKDSTNDMYRII
jgi:hypothetical protein